MIECLHQLRLTYTPYKRVKTVPLLFDFRSVDCVADAFAYLNQVQKCRKPPFDASADCYGSNRPQRLKKIIYPSLVEIHSTISKLGVKSAQLSVAGWMTLKERLREREETFDLATDRYAGLAAGVFNSGSSRHCFVGSLQLKGAGRNRLSSRNDFAHNSGYLTLPQAVMEYVLCHYLNSFLPLGAGRIAFVSIYPNSGENGFPHALLARHQPPLRHAHATPGSWLPGEFESIRNSLKSTFKTLRADKVADQLVFHHALSFVFSVFQGSIIPDNFSLISSYIDLSTVICFPGLMSLGSNLTFEPGGGDKKVKVITLNNLASLIDYSLIGSAQLLNEFLIGEIDLGELPDRFVNRVVDLQSLFEIKPSLTKKEIRHLLAFRRFGSIGSTSKALQARAQRKPYDSERIFRFCSKLPKFQLKFTPFKQKQGTFMLRLQGDFAFSGKSIVSTFNARKRESIYQVIDSALINCSRDLQAKGRKLYNASAMVNSFINDTAYINPFVLDKKGRIIRQSITLQDLWEEIKLIIGAASFETGEAKIFYEGQSHSIQIDLDAYPSFKECFPTAAEIIVFNLALKSKAKGVWIVPVFKPRIIAVR